MPQRGKYQNTGNRSRDLWRGLRTGANRSVRVDKSELEKSKGGNLTW